MKRRLLVVSILGTYFLLTWGIGHNDVVDVDHGLITAANDPSDDDLKPNNSDVFELPNSIKSMAESRDNSTSDIFSANSFDIVLPRSQNTSMDLLEINSTHYVDLLGAKSINQIKGTRFQAPPYHFDLSKHRSNKPQQVRDITAKQSTRFNDVRPLGPLEVHEVVRPPEHEFQEAIQGPQQLNYNNPYDKRLVSPSNKFDHFGFNQNMHMGMRPGFYPNYDYDIFPFNHPNSLPHPFPIRGPPRRRKRPKKKPHPVSPQPFLPPQHFSMQDGPYAHEIPHYDIVGPRPPLPRNFNFEPPPPLRNAEHPSIDPHFPPNSGGFKPNIPHFKEPPIYFRPLPPGYIFKCKTNLFFSVFTRRLCYPLPFNPTHVGW